MYFFHPLAYWAAYQLRLERELACDQLAMARSGHSPADYAQTLVQVVSHASAPASPQTAAISAGLTGSRHAETTITTQRFLKGAISWQTITVPGRRRSMRG